MRSAKTIILFLALLPQLGIAQVISTIAGTGTQGYNGDGIAATTAQLNQPHGIAIDAAGNIYIADAGNYRVRKINISTGIISTIAGTGTYGYNGDGIAATSAQISTPTAMAFDATGDLYIADRSNHRIRKIITSSGIISTIAGTGTAGYNGDGIAATSAQLNWPAEVSFDANGNLFIAEQNGNRVRKVDKITGIISTVAGTGVFGYNGDGIPATAAQLSAPVGIIFDNTGNIYISDYQGYRIRKISVSTGLISTVAGTGTGGYNGDGIAATAAKLNAAAWIKFDGAENMYIGDASNHRIRKINSLTGIITTIAGTGTGGYNGDGIAPISAMLYAPYYVGFDNTNCKMYIGDYSNSRIRKITGGFTECLPAVAKGNLVSCQVLPPVTIDNTNNNTWVPIYDTAGRIAAEIKANGNVLGVVNTSLFTKNGSCREDGTHRLYLNRNITITPQTQPSSAVSVRLYILKAELDSIKNALNSQGQPSGVASINEIDVFKNTDACATVGAVNALPLTATNSSYSSDYYLQVSVSSFSSFYFANKLLPSILPVKIYSFSGKTGANGNDLQWQADCVGPVDFNIERSVNGVDFIKIGTVSTNSCNLVFHYTDPSGSARRTYYRIKMTAGSQLLGYSVVIVLYADADNFHLNLPNPIVSSNYFHVEANATKASIMLLNLCDITGRIMYSGSFNLFPGYQTLIVNPGHLAAGKYWLIGETNDGRADPIPLIIK